MREYEERREIENFYEKAKKNIKKKIEDKGVSCKGSAKGTALSEIISVLDGVYSMSKLVTIQVHVPICPECGGGLKHNQIMQKYLCHHCGTRFKVIGFGQSERELICEEEIKHGTMETQ